MLNPEKSKAYLVTIYNKVVRQRLKENEGHALYSELWAEARIQDVNASTEAEARRKMNRRYPPEDGFVIEHVEPVA